MLYIGIDVAKRSHVAAAMGDGGEVADPYYTGDFGRTYRDVSRGCRALLDHIREEHPELMG